MFAAIQSNNDNDNDNDNDAFMNTPSSPSVAASAGAVLVVAPTTTSSDEEEEWRMDPNNPIYLGLYGYPWHYNEVAKYGNHQYLEVKRKVEEKYLKVKNPAPVRFAKLENSVTVTKKSIVMTTTTTTTTTSSSTEDAADHDHHDHDADNFDVVLDQEEDGEEVTTTTTTITTTTTTTQRHHDQRNAVSKMVILKPSELNAELGSTSYFKRLKYDEPLRMTKFAKYWMQDPDVRCIESIEFDPRRPSGIFLMPDDDDNDNDHDNDNDDACSSASAAIIIKKKKKERWAWNNWPGILAQLYPGGSSSEATTTTTVVNPTTTIQVEEMDTTVDVGLGLIRQHMLEVLFSNDEGHCEWFLDYLATIVQRPWAKTGVAVFFVGAQGAGKNTLLDWFRLRILGAAITIQLSNPKQGLFDTFGTAHQGRIVVQLDEVDPKQMRQCESGIKNLVTADSLHVQKKYKDRMECLNLVNLVGTSNDKAPFFVSRYERRLTLFNVSSSRVGDHAYFERLHTQALENDVVNRAFYDLLMARDISRFGDQLNLQKLKRRVRLPTTLSLAKAIHSTRLSGSCRLL